MSYRTSARPPVWPLRINPHSPHANGLIGCWSAWADQAGAVWDDVSGRGNRGTVTYENDAAYLPVMRPTALGGRGLRFNGWLANGDKLGYVALERTFSSLPLSVAVWFYPEATNINHILFWTGHTNWNGHYLLANSFGAVVAATAQTTTFAVSSGIPYLANRWQHAVGVWSSATSRQAYLDAVPDMLDMTNKTPASFSQTRIGSAFSGSTAALLGSIAEVRVYNRVLQPAEIMSMYLPATRWDLYSQPRQYYRVPDVAAGAVGIYGKRGVVALPGGVRIEAVQ